MLQVETWPYMYVQAYMSRGWVYMYTSVDGGGWVDEAGWSASGFLAVLSSVSQCQAVGDYLYPRLTLVSQCQAASDYLYPRLTISISVLGGIWLSSSVINISISVSGRLRLSLSEINN